ncbi:MAG: NAD(P)-binding domain-containing protein [Anaerolineales bacterium]
MNLPASDSLPAAAQELIRRFKTRRAVVGVVGLGYVGLPLAAVLGEGGYEVVGVDVDAKKVAALSRGESYLPDVPSERLRPLISGGRFRATTSFSDLGVADAVSICVPTPLRKTGDPDLSHILNAVRALHPALHSPMVIVLESTTYPGTTRELVLPELAAEGRVVGEDIFLAFSPERVDPGREDWTTENTPKIIGGVTAACTNVAAAF